MLETTPDSNPKSAINSSANSKSGVDLAPFLISPSVILWRMEIAVYSGLLCAASVALLPFFLTEFYWPIVWMLFCLFVAFELRNAWRTKNSAPILLSIQKNIWRLKKIDGEFVVEPFDEILLWPGVIILPVREVDTKRKHRIVVLPDSVKRDDWRCLRAWLRTGLQTNS